MCPCSQLSHGQHQAQSGQQRSPQSSHAKCPERAWWLVRRAPHLLVVLGSNVKPPQEDVGVAQIAVCSPFRSLVPKLLGNGKSLEEIQAGSLSCWDNTCRRSTRPPHIPAEKHTCSCSRSSRAQPREATQQGWAGAHAALLQRKTKVLEECSKIKLLSHEGFCVH